MRKSLFFSCIAAIVFVVVISAVTANVSGVKKSPFEFHDIQLNGNSRVTAVVVSNDSDIPLKKENTGVTVDGQTIGDFSLTPVNDESTALILAFDVSRSMNGIPLASAKKYASYLLAPITDGNYVMLMTFGNYIRILENLTDDKDTLISKTDSLTALEQKTLLYRAISDGLKLAEKSKTAKTSMLVITDAKDDHSDITFEELLKDFKKPHIPIHVMVYGNNRLYFESLDNITKLTKGTMLVNPGFEEIQGLSRAIFIPKRVKYLIDYKYAGAAGKHECLVKLKYQGGEISLKREFALPPSGATTVPAGTAQSTPQSTPEPKSTVTAVTKAESPGSIGELMLNYQWLILLIIIFLLFLIVLILLLSKKKGADTSVTFAVKDMQSELKLINARLSEIHKSELIITDNEGLEGFIHSLMNKFVEGTHENIKNILRRLEIETKNAIANIGEIKSQEYVLLQENISNLSGVLQSRISVVESALERIREMYKTEQSAGAERAQAMVADILSAKIAELKQELTVSFNSKYETLTGALSDIPSMKIQSETYYAGVESRLSGLSLEISTMAANFETSLSAAISQAVQETDYEKIAEANKETLKDFENKLEMLTLTTCGIPTLKAGLEDFMLAIESKLTTLSTELSTMAAAFDNRLETTLKQSVPTPVHEKIDYEKIADAGKETLKDFENRLEALSSFIAGIPPMKSAFEKHQTEIEEKLSGITKQISEINKGTTLQYEKTEIDYEKLAEAGKESLKDFESRLEALSSKIGEITFLKTRFEENQTAIERKLASLTEQLSEYKQDVQKTDTEKIDYEKLAEAGKESLKDFESRLEALSSFIAGIPPMKGAFEKHQTEIEEKLSGITKQISEINKGTTLQYEKTEIDYEKLAEAGKESLKDFESRLEALSSKIGEITFLKTRFEENQTVIERKLTSLTEQLSEYKQAVQKTDTEKIDYEKITDANKETLKDFESRLEALSSFIAGIPPMKGAFEKHQTEIEEKLSGITKQISEINKGTTLQYEKTEIDYEKIADAGKETLKDFESRLESLSSSVADIALLKSKLVENQAGIDGKLSGLSAEMAPVKDALVYIIRFLMSVPVKRK